MAYRSMVCTHFSVHASFYCQGLTLVSRCSQLSRGRHPAAGTPLLQSRPGRGNHLMIGPAAMVAWYGGTNRSHSKGNGPNLALTQGQPRTLREVLRGERPKWLFVPFGQSKGTPSGKRPHQAGKPETGTVRRSTPDSGGAFGRERPRRGRWSAPEKWSKVWLPHRKEKANGFL